MDVNVVTLTGRLAAPPEVRSFDTGARLARLLVTVRTEHPERRIDVVPVSWWEPPDSASLPAAGTAVTAIGALLHRRFWSGVDGRRSRLEIVSRVVCLDGGRSGPGYPLADATGRDLSEHPFGGGGGGSGG